ncbi:MAG: response regulator [Magnetococcales bacterium]|nr:response regulator [Magnetococcales bacterium]
MADILIIDDDTDILIHAETVLAKAGHTVRTAVDGISAIQLFREIKPDLVITDIFMPTKSGLSLIPELRIHNPDIRIIALSGGMDGVGMAGFILESAKKAGALLTHEKPVSKEALLGLVQEALSISL